MVLDISRDRSRRTGIEELKLNGATALADSIDMFIRWARPRVWAARFRIITSTGKSAYVVPTPPASNGKREFLFFVFQPRQPNRRTRMP